MECSLRHAISFAPLLTLFSVVALFTVTLFASAGLLFLVQPMFARLVLPLLGGSPAVWNTAMVFYQAALLAGYGYAHFSNTRLSSRRQAVLQLLLFLIPLALLPIAIPAGWSPPANGHPALWQLALMSVSVGLPFFAISTTSPVLQKWFAASGHPRAVDPYFLYVASNIGSLLALLAYPFLLEPRLALATQTRLWMWGYFLLLALVAACAVVLWKTARPSVPSAAVTTGLGGGAPAAPTPVPSARRRTRWVLLSFAPSSLMLGVTTYLSSEIAVVPLLWIVPLALYLLTFVIVFARRPLLPRQFLLRALPIVMVALVMVINMRATQPIAWLMALHVVAFFLAALLCHGALAVDRPSSIHLTEFYLWMSVGGVLGGLFNALLAPALFNTIVEYPLAVLLACLLALLPPASAASPASPSIPPATRPAWSDFLWPVALGLATIALLFTAGGALREPAPAVVTLVFGVPTLICFFFSRRPLRFVLGLAALLLAGTFYHGEQGRALHTERSFFGVHRVTRDPAGRHHLLIHGNTLHGQQSLDPARRAEPLTYYHRTGPVGQILATFGADPQKKIAAVGLGAGSLAAYAAPRQSWTYFEIDPVVERLARDVRYFTFLRDSPADLRVVLGDARLTLAAGPAGAFDLIVLDAFSSDAIPVHLVTREALALYQSKLAPGGLIVCHISNLHLDLEPVFSRLAHDAQLACLVRDDTVVSAAESALGKAPSVWLVLARTPADLAPLANDARWRPALSAAGRVWTDDYSSLLAAFRWH